MPLRPRQPGRYRQNAEVLTRHGLGAVVAQLGLDRYLGLPHRLLRREPRPEMTPAKHVTCVICAWAASPGEAFLRDCVA